MFVISSSAQRLHLITAVIALVNNTQQRLRGSPLHFRNWNSDNIISHPLLKTTQIGNWDPDIISHAGVETSFYPTPFDRCGTSDPLVWKQWVILGQAWIDLEKNCLAIVKNVTVQHMKEKPTFDILIKIETNICFHNGAGGGGWWLCDYDSDSGLEFDFVWHQMLQEPWPEDDSEDRWLSQVADLIIIIIITIDLKQQYCFCCGLSQLTLTSPRLKLWPTSGRQEDCGWVPSSPSEHFNTWGKGSEKIQYFSKID